jgi:hypothetical protein
MPEDLAGDLTDAVIWGADLTGARFRDVNLTGVRISHAWVVDVEIDALVERLVVNGVDVTDFVNERDPWHPLRSMLRVTDVDGARASWAALEEAWADTVAQARRLPEDALHESVDGEWSFVQTVRHLVMAIDKWLVAPILGQRFHPIGLPNTGSLDFPFPGIDLDQRPTLDEALAVHAERAALVRNYLATMSAEDLDRPVEVLENGTNPVRECLFTVFEETFWHVRYARRDLAVLAARAG